MLHGPERWMNYAMALAEHGRGKVSPNPLVGACLVNRGQLIGEGYHAYYGGPHAEVVALKKAGARARGATFYVTLEPCSTWGKTRPCVQAILRAGVRRVVVGMLDPNPRHHGKGVRALKKAGIQVTSGVLAPEIRKQNEVFRKYITLRRALVTLKMAQTLDGKIATRTGDSRWVTSGAARRFVHRLRREADAVLVGTGTVLRDNPRLTARAPGTGRPALKPWRIFLDASGKVPSDFRIFRTAGPLTVRVISRDRMGVIAKQKQIKSSGQILLAVSEDHGQLDLQDLLCQLAELGIAHLLVEGGGETAWSFLKGGFVDRVYWFVAPKVIGGRDAKTSVEGEGILRMREAMAVKNVNCRRLGNDWLFEGEC